MNEGLNFEALPFDSPAHETGQSAGEMEWGRRVPRGARMYARRPSLRRPSVTGRRSRRPWPPGRPRPGVGVRLPGPWQGIWPAPSEEPVAPPAEEPVAPPWEEPAPPTPAAAADDGRDGNAAPAATADGGEEGEVRAEVSATIAWAPSPFSLTQMLGAQPYLKSRGGVYVVARAGQQPPVYVGISDDLRTRWSTRLALFGELGVAGLLGKEPFSGFVVYIGRVQPQADSRLLPRKDLLESVERVLIRHLKEVRKYPLTNRRGSRPFTVGGRGISVTNEGNRPWFLPPVISGGVGQTFELGPALAFEAEPFPATRG
jgi:hypothetical protein